MQAVEVASGLAFASVGMAEIAHETPLTTEILGAYQRNGRAWVAVDPADRPVAFVVFDVVDGCAHVEQVAVGPEHARRGVGRALLAHTQAVALGQGMPALTLTAFLEVPWNAPYYERIGFHRLPDHEVTAGLREIRRREAARGLDRWPRVCMRRETLDHPVT